MSSRQQLSQREIDQVLARYKIGTIHSVNELAAGSVYSPKVVVNAERGKLLLKRRARGLDLPTLVAFSHEVLLQSLEAGICVPPLIGTKENNNSMVQFEDRIYELFVFIEGTPFDRSEQMIAHHSNQAGGLLSELHFALDRIETSFEPTTESDVIDLSRLPLLSQNPVLGDAGNEQLTRIMQFGDELAKANAEKPGIVHGDWHPGNMIFHGQEIVAICDFDNTRVGSRSREVAQAMIHCSLRTPTKGQTAQTCDPDPDKTALIAFWKGYSHRSESQSSPRCSPRTCAGLMASVMIDEALASQPSNSAGDGRAQYESMLIAASRKAIWIDQHQSELIDALESVQ
jgi:Ser/Thr protein kinase RdoA (MazF antagonist)